jgi:hypothetical protein
MSQMSNLNLLLGEIIEHGEAILEAAKEIRNIFSEEAENPALPEKKETKAAKKEPAAPAKELTFTDVRAKLANKSREGFTADIKEILKSHGAEKLSDIQPADYEAVLKEVEALSHE